ncbi:hypothetical protein GE09DRAFT_1060259 [Coniochaeta sp. 2T2.1]|nr:hypothetical protein GE09DRAFT_1060259 [Coniochaeta sp. 2T2.1]
MRISEILAFANLACFAAAGPANMEAPGLEARQGQGPYICSTKIGRYTITCSVESRGQCDDCLRAYIGRHSTQLTEMMPLAYYLPIFAPTNSPVHTQPPLQSFSTTFASYWP